MTLSQDWKKILEQERKLYQEHRRKWAMAWRTAQKKHKDDLEELLETDGGEVPERIHEMLEELENGGE
jgi:hypothetical protein